MLDRAVTLRNMMKNRERMEKVAAFVAEHFKTTIEPMGYKAFLVAVDREACALYKADLDRHLPAGVLRGGYFERWEERSRESATLSLE